MTIDALSLSTERIFGRAEPTWVSTTTVLPSGAIVSVEVRPSGSGTFVVSDGGAALNDLHAIGLALGRTDSRRAQDIAERYGLTWDNGAFSVREVTADQLASAIVFVAESSRSWASSAVENASRRREASVADQMRQRLGEIIPSTTILKEVELEGASSKRHRFDLAVVLPGKRFAVFEVVSSNANSLSATHLKLFDLMQAHSDWPREAVTDSFDNWQSADIALLSAVASHVREVSGNWADLPSLLVH